MIFVVGGAYQGKEAFARKLAGERFGETPFGVVDCGQERTVFSGMGEPPAGSPVSCGVLLNFHEFVRGYLKTHPGAAEEEICRQVALAAEQNPQAVITMDEVGCGVVPMSREERQYRDAAGRAGQELARRAEQVWRVIAGIAVRIK